MQWKTDDGADNQAASHFRALALSLKQRAPIPHLQNGFRHAQSFLLLLLDASPSEAIVDTAQYDDHTEETPKYGHDIVRGGGWVAAGVRRSHSPRGEGQASVVVVL